MALDYHNLSSDVVLAAPLQHGNAAERRRQSSFVYILIEHQSQPDRSMPLRLPEYDLS